MRPYPQRAADREAAQVQSGHSGEYADWDRRVFAYLIDILIVFALLVAAWFTVPWLYAVLSPGTDGWPVLILVIFAIPALYYVYFVGNERGQTVGRRAIGIQVRTSDTGGPVGYGRAAARYVVALIGMFAFPLMALDYLWPFWDSRNQTVHDKAARTIVVRSNAPDSADRLR